MKRQLATYVVVAEEVARGASARSLNVAVNAVTSAVASSITASAGISRRTRRAQKPVTATRPVRSTSTAAGP